MDYSLDPPSDVSFRCRALREVLQDTRDGDPANTSGVLRHHTRLA